MQFEMTSTVFSCNKVTVDGKTYCSIFTGQHPIGENAANTLGFEVTKIAAEPVVFDQLQSQGFHAGDDVKLVAMLKKAANGKSQPHIIGIVPGQKPVSTDNKAKASA
ncbi:hypothetical protein [Marinobacter sp.]|uniref:hypothetical protein n=1 Tax=Marinobacter sp. TaxID=50741 RepID=UPI0019C9AC2A|nr:hypothetical protein [Marinobacter sp.]MBD3657804.1 hypothetical protein [Marinobacter sp.]